MRNRRFVPSEYCRKRSPWRPVSPTVSITSGMRWREYPPSVDSNRRFSSPVSEGWNAGPSMSAPPRPR